MAIPNSSSSDHESATAMEKPTAQYAQHVKSPDSGFADPENHQGGPVSTKRLMSLVAMAIIWTGSQIPVYLFGGVTPYIYGDIGGTDRWIWFVLANLLSLAAVCPFVGSLSDLLGRRYVAILGTCFILLGMVVSSTAHTMNWFICGMTFAGIGAGITELTAVALLVLSIVPFCPSVLWAQLIAYHSTWRYIGVVCSVWNFIGLALLVVFYFPPPRINLQDMTRRQVLAKIDYIGGFLSIAGLILFLAGMQWGGYQYKWTSVHVLVPLLIGAGLLAAFVVWEGWFASYPIYSKRLHREPRILLLTLVITFISGANFFSLVMFWPAQAFNVYGHDPVGVGIRGLPVAFGILTGALIVLLLLSRFRGRNRELLIVSSILMTAGCGGLAAAERDNLNIIWIVLVIGSLGIGGIVVPTSIITTIVCPDDLIATVTALTLAIRVIGGSIGYCIYFNVFAQKFVPYAMENIGRTLAMHNITSPAIIGEVVELTGASLLHVVAEIPGIKGNETIYNAVVLAGQLAYAAAYKHVYYVSTAFGGISVIAACFLGDINKFMTDDVAVTM